MKWNYLILIFALLGTQLVPAQERQLYTEKTVKEMPVFPGCEEIRPTRKGEITRCLSYELSRLLQRELQSYEVQFANSGMSEAEAEVLFIITREGQIGEIREKAGSNALLASAAAHSLERIALDLPPITPAKLKSGMPVDIVLALPITFKITAEKTETVHTDFPVDEVVLFTLLDENPQLRYEVRLYKDRDLKVYELDGDQTTFLGKFLSLNEIRRSEPYKTSLERGKREGRILVTDGMLDGEYYEVFIYNVFEKSESEPVYVEILSLVNNKMKKIAEFSREEDFNHSRFAPLIYRE